MSKGNHSTETNPTHSAMVTPYLHESFMQEVVARARWFCDGRAIERDVARQELVNLLQDCDVEMGFVHFFAA